MFLCVLLINGLKAFGTRCLIFGPSKVTMGDKGLNSKSSKERLRKVLKKTKKGMPFNSEPSTHRLKCPREQLRFSILAALKHLKAPVAARDKEWLCFGFL